MASSSIICSTTSPSTTTNLLENYLNNHNSVLLKSQPDLQDVIDCHKINKAFYALPIELLNDIIEKVYYDYEDYDSITSQLESFSKTILPVNKVFNAFAKKLLYRYCIFTRPNSFQDFLSNLMKDPSLGLNVKFIDFMEFTSIGLGRTGKMNQEIQMVTNNTILQCLKLTPNLIEFLASESIDTDIDLNILNCLFNELPHLKSLDFCGATNINFVKSFNDLTLNKENNIAKLSFHDCTNLSPDVFIKVLPYMPNLKRLDLSHTLISAKILFNFLHKSARLTHLSLSRCTNLTTRELMEFLIHHDSIKEGSLLWLNLQVDSSNVSPINKDQLTILLKQIEAPNLKYLNLGGLPICDSHLQIVLNRFPLLESLGLSNNQLSFQEIVTFLGKSATLKAIDLSHAKNITKWTIDQSVLLDASPSLEAIEISNRIIDDIPYHLIAPFSVWKTFDNNRSSRRAWIYKVSEVERNKILKDPGYNSDMINNLIFYDVNTGKKIKKINRPPTFLKYCSKKINCSVGFFSKNINDNDDEVFPVEYSERGIHKYYSLNK